MAGAKMVDRNGMRGGAALSGLALLVAFVFEWRPAAPLLALALAIGAVFGPPVSPLGVAYRALKRALRLPIPVEPEEAAPPRFAQGMGATALAIASFAFYPLANDTLGWLFVLAVGALQILLASTGICVGCAIYSYARRAGAKGA